jgi:translation initiation factor IF-2
MSKIRIYEIAKELGMAHGVVLERAKEIGLAVIDHLSFLDDAEVARLKAAMTQGKGQPVEEKRVNQTVIRRRSKKDEVPEVAPAAPVAAPAPAKVAAAVVVSAPEEEKPRRRVKKEEVPAPAPEVVAVEVEAPVAEAPASATDEPTPAEPEETPVAEAPLEQQPEAEVEAPAEEPAPAPVAEEPVPAVEAPAPPAPPAVPEGTVASDLPSANGEPVLEKRTMSINSPDRRRSGYRAVVVSMPDPAELARQARKAAEAAVVVQTPAPAAPALDAFGKPRKKVPGKREDDDSKRGKRVIYDRKKDSSYGRENSPGSRLKARRHKDGYLEEPLKFFKRTVKMNGAISVGELASGMAVKVSDLMKKLFSMGVMATVNQPLDFETAALIAQELGHEVVNAGFDVNLALEAQTTNNEEASEASPRAPIVTIMGHVDHGKTSLLDAIQKTNIAGGEAGGITQAIGAYVVRTKKGPITFIDTPGHEAFTAMRARGAKVTDIVILVVAGDDGVMPQTVEALNHAKSANVPIVVAINKMDKPGADAARVRQELSQHGILSEEWGGQNIFVEVSAKKATGIQDLLDAILLQAEVMELKASVTRMASGLVLESRLDKGRGPVATVLVLEGTLNVGDLIISGACMGRVKGMADDKGRKLKSAGPATPVEVQGFNGVPVASDPFNVVRDEKAAKVITEFRGSKARDEKMVKTARVTLEGMFAATASGKVDVKLVLKADTQGAVEAARQALIKLDSEKVGIDIIHDGVGGINENDVNLAAASHGFIVGYNVRPDIKAKSVADQMGVELKLFSLIHDLLDTVKAAMEGALAKEENEVYLGQAEIRQVFSVPKAGKVAGSYVTDGKIKRTGQARLLRSGAVIWTGRLSSLKRFKDDAKEVAQGYECGIGLENYNDIKVGDIIESFEIEMVAGTLE